MKEFITIYEVVISKENFLIISLINNNIPYLKEVVFLYLNFKG